MKVARRAIRDSVAVKWILLFGELFCSQYFSSAQGLYNESSVYINGVNLYVDGEINNGGLLLNNGHLTFTTDWESKGSYKGGGVLEAGGPGPQKIAHYDQDVGTLAINSWGTKYIRGGIRLVDEFQLIKGIVEVSPKDELSLVEGAVISGGSAESYVDGALTVEGTGYRFFPVGKNGTYAPIQFLDIKGKGAKFSVEVFENAPVIPVNNAIVKKALYWQRNDLQGAFEGSPVAVGYDPSLFTDVAKIIMLGGTDWDSPFLIISNTELDEKTHKLSTRTDVMAPIIMLGEMTDVWTESDFYFSTALSPNAANAENRKVRIFGERLSGEAFHLTVFNRWGAVVYETRSLEIMLNNGWDGRSMDGDELMAGVYPYKLTAVDKTGGKFEKKGIITIMY